MERLPEVKPQEEKEILLPPWVEQIKDIYNEIMSLSKTQRRKRFGRGLADDLEIINENRVVADELFFWEETRDLFHNYGITDYGVVTDGFIKKRMEENK